MLKKQAVDDHFDKSEEVFRLSRSTEKNPDNHTILLKWIKVNTILMVVVIALLLFAIIFIFRSFDSLFAALIFMFSR